MVEREVETVQPEPEWLEPESFPLEPLPEERSAYLAECQADETMPQAGETVPPSPAVIYENAPVDRVRGFFANANQELAPHLEELRWRLVISLAAFVPAFACGLLLYRRLWDILLTPLEKVDVSLVHFQALSPADGMILTLEVALAFALIVSTPVWVSQLWCFISPGLKARERRWFYLALGAGGALFFAGVLMAFYLALPLALGYLLPLNQSLTGWENSFTGSGYVNFIAGGAFAFGIAFETPLLMLVLAWLGLLTPAGIRSYWRQIVLGVFIMAAVLTPPEPLSQILLALPLLLLFGLGYLLVYWVRR
ncbi:MAG: twin-arginine translocase subunit TatC [Planctomycetota bacterium]|jgi:sec-independent protein translocase protein TatC|nr:twin-arginine translocase subunit TatC [Planctomycetota bacterium]